MKRLIIFLLFLGLLGSTSAQRFYAGGSAEAMWFFQEGDAAFSIRQRSLFGAQLGVQDVLIPGVGLRGTLAAAGGDYVGQYQAAADLLFKTPGALNLYFGGGVGTVITPSSLGTTDYAPYFQGVVGSELKVIGFLGIFGELQGRYYPLSGAYLFPLRAGVNIYLPTGGSAPAPQSAPEMAPVSEVPSELPASEQGVPMTPSAPAAPPPRVQTVTEESPTPTLAEPAPEARNEAVPVAPQVQPQAEEPSSQPAPASPVDAADAADGVAQQGELSSGKNGAVPEVPAVSTLQDPAPAAAANPAAPTTAPTTVPKPGEENGNSLPVARIIPQQALKLGPPPVTTHFRVAAMDPDGDPLSYIWNLNPDVTDPKITHTFKKAGIFEIIARVSDGKGETVTRLTVTVEDR